MKSHSALLNEAEPVAASPSVFIIKFKHEIHCQMAMDNHKFVETVSNAFQTLVGNRFDVLGIPEEQWQTIRESFLSSHESDQQEGGPNKEEEPLISEAKRLFGADFVEVID
jgi:DNA polymerase-3 subunit gamma/tau